MKEEMTYKKAGVDLEKEHKSISTILAQISK